jgi:hypothetical protein
MMRVFEVGAASYFRAIRVFCDATEAEAWLTSMQAGENPGH